MLIYPPFFLRIVFDKSEAFCLIGLAAPLSMLRMRSERPGSLVIAHGWKNQDLSTRLKFSSEIETNLFSRRFREGISFPNLLERSIPKLPLSRLCAVPFALQNRALFEGENRAKRCPEKGRKRGGQQRGQKGKKDAWKQVRKQMTFFKRDWKFQASHPPNPYFCGNSQGPDRTFQAKARNFQAFKWDCFFLKILRRSVLGSSRAPCYQRDLW